MTSRSPLALVTLTGTYVRLEPLNPSHLPGLNAAVSGPRNSFTYAWVPTPDPQDLSWFLGEADHGGSPSSDRRQPGCDRDWRHLVDPQSPTLPDQYRG